jgi:hypothetical protein
MRAVSNSVMAALVVAALFWGNCFSCPQVLLSLTSKQPAHGCCHRTKQAPQDCRTQVLQNFVKADPMGPAPALPVVAEAAITPLTGFEWHGEWPPEPEEHAPPDRLLSLRI